MNIGSCNLERLEKYIYFPDNKIRQIATQKYKEFCDENFGKFFMKSVITKLIRKDAKSATVMTCNVFKSNDQDNITGDGEVELVKVNGRWKMDVPSFLSWTFD